MTRSPYISKNLVQILLTRTEAEGLAEELASSTDRGFREFAESIYADLEATDDSFTV